jgi:flagellar basal-body rod protein FlgC
VGLGGGVRGLFRGLDIASSGLSAQRRRIEVVATNIANAETTRTAEGGPYRRRVVELAAGPWGEQWPGVVRAGESPVRIRAGELPGMGSVRELGVVVQNVWEDPGKGQWSTTRRTRTRMRPATSAIPNVRVTEELVTMMEARRLYEANATVFDAVKAMLRRATEI